MSGAADPLAVEALRVNTRYLDEVVVAWRLCPFAERALADGRVRRWVLPAARPALADVQACVEEMAAEPDAIIGLCIFPRAELSAAAFDSFAETVRRGERARRFLLAAFHPFASTSFSTAPELVSFVRRTPDPTLQLVRAGDGGPAGRRLRRGRASELRHRHRRGRGAPRRAPARHPPRPRRELRASPGLTRRPVARPATPLLLREQPSARSTTGRSNINRYLTSFTNII